MREVPAKLFGFMREMSRQAGADVEAAQEGLALRRVDVDAPGVRVDWDEVAIFLERAHGHLSPEEMERVGEIFVATHVWQQLVARALGTPRLLYKVCSETLVRAAFPHLHVVVEPHATGVRWEMRLPDEYEPSLFYFRANAGEARMLVTLLGRPPARVEADVGPRHGIYDIDFGEGPSTRDRAFEMAAAASDMVVTEMIALMRRAVSAGLPDDDDKDATVLDLQRHLGLTLTEARVTSRLVAGLTVNEIARALGVRVSTVRSHLKSVYAKTGTRGQTELVRLVLTNEWRQRGG